MLPYGVRCPTPLAVEAGGRQAELTEASIDIAGSGDVADRTRKMGNANQIGAKVIGRRKLLIGQLAPWVTWDMWQFP